MRTSPFLLLLALTALAHADDRSFSTRLEEACGRLASPRAEKRSAGLASVDALVREDAARCRRAVRSLADLLRRRPPEEGAQAIRILARIPEERAHRLWLEHLDPEVDHRLSLAAVAAASDRAEDPVAHRALLELARSEDATAARRALALEALGVIRSRPAHLLLLRPSAEPEDWRLASGRALGLTHLGGPDAFAALLTLLDHANPAPRVHAWEGLVTLTGEALPAQRAPWQAWREAHPDFFDGPRPAPPVPATEGDERYEGKRPVHVPRYYGVPIDRPRSRVVFCLDVSQSMYGRGIEQARSELTRTILDCPSTYAFDVIAFNENVMPFAKELRPAHPVVKHQALRWLEALETISYTNLYDAVELAFGYRGLHAIFLLSDGAPNRGKYRRDDKVVEAIAELSRKRVPVHCVAAGEEVFPLLRRIADATGGRFVDAFDFE